jgi:hypothetical protein
VSSLSIKLLPSPSMKLTPLSMEFCQVSSAFKSTTKSEFTSSTTVDVKIDNTVTSTTIYTATTNEEKVTYT